MAKNEISNILSELEETKKYLKESYIFDEEGPEDINDQPSEAEYETNDGGVDLSKDDERISQIREIALQGLSDYANNVDSEFYKFWKRIWLECDKMCDNRNVK